MEIKKNLKALDIRISKLASELGVSRPTLDSYIECFENGHAIPNEGYQRIFEYLFSGEQINSVEFAQRYDYVKRVMLSDAKAGAEKNISDQRQDSILKNIKEHYKRLDIVKPLWVEKKYLSVYELLRETVNPNSKDKTPIPNMSAMVLQSILSGNRYPASLYTDTVIRIRSEQGNVTWGRASIIKAYLIKNYSWKEGENYMGLEETCNDTAYILGRLFSVLESIQKEANQGINATIKDRYFNSACATPASVFPILFKLENSHIKKLEREKGSGSKIFYEKIIGNLMKKLVLFPRSLSLEEQGKFMLGYYHQTQKKYEKKEDK